MSNPTLQSKARRGRKDDSSLHEFAREVSRRREALGLPPVDNDFDPEKTMAEWYQEEAAREQFMKQARKNASTKNDKRLVRQFTISIEQIPEHGYWAYCSAVNGKRLHGETMAEAWEKMAAYLSTHLEKLVAKDKPLVKTGTRMKK